MFLITGSAGKTGQAIIKILAGNQYKVRAFTHKYEYVEGLKNCGAAAVFVGDMLRRSDLQSALEGVSAIYHICPNMHPKETEIGKNVIEAAKSVGCASIVYHSVLHPQTKSMPHHWKKLQVEEALFESGLTFTILQPCAYMQNISPELDKIIAGSVYRTPYRAASTFSLVDVNDVAEVAYKILTSTDHNGATYELNGPEILSQLDMVDILSAETNSVITFEYQTIDEWKTVLSPQDFQSISWRR